MSSGRALPAIGSKWWRTATREGPWFVEEVTHVVRLYLPGELSPCGSYAFVPVRNWPAGFIGIAATEGRT